MRTKRRIIVAIILCFAFCAVFSFAFAAMETKEYKDLDVVVVMDTSGSMRKSDPERVSSAAVKMLINMMPAEGSRVGIVTFNSKATPATERNGKAAILELSELNNVNSLKRAVDNIAYKGDTGIGNALIAASEMLQASERVDAQKAIILFTDGVDDLPTEEQMNKNDSNREAAIDWARNNNCLIYCVGFNYINSDGIPSMGKEGDGIKKLNSISEPTNGFTKATSDINEIEDIFIQMLANICSLYYNDIASVPGDGGTHEVVIPINPSVIEANIRISSNTRKAISRGNIELIDPDSNSIELNNSKYIRYDVDATAASIKVITPKTGNWILVLSNVIGDEIKIGLLEHYDLGIVSELVTEGERPYIGKTVEIIAKLTNEDEVIEQEAIYDLVERAEITVVQADGAEQILAMEKDGACFKASFVPEQEGDYTIGILLEAAAFYRNDELSFSAITEPNSIPIMIKSFEDVELEKGDFHTVSQVMGYASDEDGPLETVVVQAENSDIAQVSYNSLDDSIIISGKKMGETVVNVQYLDGAGASVQSSFNVTVVDLVGLILRIAIIVAAIALLVLIIALIRKKKRCIKGAFYIDEILLKRGRQKSTIRAEYDVDDEIKEEYYIKPSRVFSTASKRNLKALIENIVSMYEFDRNGPKADLFAFCDSDEGDEILKIAKKVSVVGTYKGKKGMVFVIPKDVGNISINRRTAGKVPVGYENKLEIFIAFDMETKGAEEDGLTLEISYKKK